MNLGGHLREGLEKGTVGGREKTKKTYKEKNV